MKTKIYLGCLLALSLTASSCSDFLTEDPKGRLSELNYPKAPADITGAVNALYTQLNYSSAGAHVYAYAWMGDDITTIAGGNKDVFRQYDVYSVNDNNSDTKAGWINNYKIIKACNYILNTVDGATAPDADKNLAKAQAHFWRAFAYFRLVRWYGEVPLVTKTDIDFTIEKSSVADVYALIEKDLNDALPLVPDSYDKAPGITNQLNNYANKGAVQALLSAVYMAHAGYPLNATAYYQKAAEMAKAVIDGAKSGKYYYKLEDKYADKYKYVSNNNSKEIVVGLQYNRDNINWGWDGLTTFMGVSQGFAVTGGWDDLIGEVKYFVEMPDGPRKDVIYGDEGGKILVHADKNPLNGQKVNWYDEVVSEQHPMFRSLMYGDKDGQRVDYNSNVIMRVEALTGQTLRFLSFNEVMLWYAEAKARTGQIDAEAKECLNKIMTRAYGTDQTAKVEQLAADPNAFAAQCVKEHGYEVAGYIPALVTRACDQLRMNTLKDNLKARVTNAPVTYAGKSFTEGVHVSDPTWNDSRNYAAIPNGDLTLNPNMGKAAGGAAQK